VLESSDDSATRGCGDCVSAIYSSKGKPRRNAGGAAYAAPLGIFRWRNQDRCSEDMSAVLVEGSALLVAGRLAANGPAFTATPDDCATIHARKDCCRPAPAETIEAAFGSSAQFVRPCERLGCGAHRRQHRVDGLRRTNRQNAVDLFGKCSAPTAALAEKSRSVRISRERARRRIPLLQAQASRAPVLLVTGFLGSGKTILINRRLKTRPFAPAAVVVNEYGEVSIDHVLVQAPRRRLRVVDGGCLCGHVREELSALSL
jgi:CobW/HypB/UreG, nucleotide-binding domain